MRIRWSWALAALVAVGLSASGARAADFQRSAIPGWKLSLQAWTYNKLSVVETIDKAKELGIQFIECFPGQKSSKEIAAGFGPGMSPEATKAVRDKLTETGCHIIAFGVTGVPGDEKGCRSFFEWAQSWGIRCINTEIHRDQMAVVDKIAEEFGIRVGMHNHPKPSYYWDPAKVVSETDGFPFIGACADTGHWPRSGLVPIDCIKKLEGKIMALHFKDLDKSNTDQPWGTGTNDAKGMLAELKRQGYQGNFSIEYEHWDANLDSNVRKCAEWWFATVKELAEGK